MARRRVSKRKSANYLGYEFDAITLLTLSVIIVFASFFLYSIRILSLTNIPKPSCTQTTLVKDGHALTTAYFNPPPGQVTGDVDATGCDIGVYFNNGLNNSVDSANIHGAKYFGIVADGTLDKVGLDVKNSNIYQIGNLPFDGTQHGVAVYYEGNASGTVHNNLIYRYQKGGVVADGANADVTVTGNSVNGLGKVDFIAQNGIQFSRGASGLISDNKIYNNFYTGTAGVGPNPGGQNPPGWQYTSGGILLYQPGNVKNYQNKFSDNQKNLEMVP